MNTGRREYHEKWRDANRNIGTYRGRGRKAERRESFVEGVKGTSPLSQKTRSGTKTYVRALPDSLFSIL